MNETKFNVEFDFPFAEVVKGKVPEEYTPITHKQEQYIDIICNFLDIDNPCIETKEEAQRWLEKHAPIYERECFRDAAYAMCLHEDAGDRGD